jgi:hydrogenase expression/formation protein HypC
VVSLQRDYFTAEVDVLGNIKKVSVVLLPDVEVGSWVLVHAGQAITMVSDEEANASLEVWEELLREQGQL